jgi:hypothetical protein
MPFTRRVVFPARQRGAFAHTLSRGVYHMRNGKELNVVPDEDGSSKPLVVCLGWTGGTTKQLKKYTELFAKHADCDSLILESHPKMVYSPSYGKLAMADLATTLASPELKDRPLIFACFSVGAYLFGHLQNVLRERGPPDHVNSRIRCLVFDSPVDYWGVPMGLSRAMAGGKTGTATQRLLKASIDAYLSAFTSVTEQYLASSNAFHAYTTAAPSLWLLSEGDVVTSPDLIRIVHQKWEARRPGTVTEISFADSPHVLHMRKHPKDYEARARRRVILMPPHDRDTRPWGTCTTLF